LPPGLKAIDGIWSRDNDVEFPFTGSPTRQDEDRGDGVTDRIIVLRSDDFAGAFDELRQAI
jgi:hypothetical protein